MKINSFAKINLGIEVLGKRADGYHDIRTLFQSIDLADVLEFYPAGEGRIDLAGDDPAIPWDESNLVHRAASLLARETGCRRGVRIKVAKSIPAGKGLGGGSSNAAMTLLGLDLFWALGLGRERLVPFARDLGADVPYFLEGGLCLGEERGDRLTRLPDIPPLFVVLAFPPFPVATAGIYAAWRPSLTSKGKLSKIKRFLKNSDFVLLENQLEETIFRSFPQLETHKRFFQDQGALVSLVSGTGSAVFGLFRQEADARRAERELRKTVPARLVETLPGGTYGSRLRAGA
jgi:4-diphosphocytidyl-2-C-methyl-D-erythritol kinase